jgi:hypothetical protein
MFPNFRLTIVAILASIVGISCGLGLFAAFRVNHEPLAGLSSGKPSLQLAFDSVEPAGDAAAPFGIRFQVSVPAAIAAPVVAPPPLPLPPQAETTPANDGPHQEAVPNAGAESTTTAQDQVATATTAGQAPPPPPDAAQDKPASAASVDTAAGAKVVHKTARRRRVAHRLYRPQAGAAAPAADQNFIGAAQGFPWTPQTPQPRAATKRTSG